MKTVRLRLALALAVGLIPVGASATPVLVGVGATAAVTYEGPVNYQGVGTFEGTFVSKSQTLLIASLTATYATSDFDFAPGGFRWTETITNNTGVSWSQYSLELGANGIFFDNAAFPTPTFATVTPGAPPTVAATAAPGSVVLSANEKRIDLVFAAPLAPGASFALHMPIEGLANGPSSFQITETAVAAVTAVPEPGTMLLLATGVGVSFVRRRWTRREDGNLK